VNNSADSTNLTMAEYYMDQVRAGIIDAPPGATVYKHVITPDNISGIQALTLMTPEMRAVLSKPSLNDAPPGYTYSGFNSTTGTKINSIQPLATSGIAAGYQIVGEYWPWHAYTVQGSITNINAIALNGVEYAVVHQWGRGQSSYGPENDIVVFNMNDATGHYALFGVYSEAYHYYGGQTAYVQYFRGGINDQYILQVTDHLIGGNLASGWSYDMIVYNIYDVTTNTMNQYTVALRTGQNELIYSADFALEWSYPPTTPNYNWIDGYNYHVWDANGNLIDLSLNTRFSEHPCQYFTNSHSETYSSYNGLSNTQAVYWQAKN
jgi:hypothetical protein